ncbi:MAG: type VI secretion system tube protein TssD [Candidatus Hodarchaeales archaeon]
MKQNEFRKLIIPIVLILGVIGLVFLDAQASIDETNDVTETSAMTTSIFLELEGTSQGAITGGSEKAGHEGWIEILSYSHSLIRPIDPATGLATGKVQHSPLRLTKFVDRATPLLINALNDNEAMNKFTLQFYEPLKTGSDLNYFTITLEDARVISIQASTSVTTGTNMHTETISFVYTKITWTWEELGIVAEAYWNDAPA